MPRLNAAWQACHNAPDRPRRYRTGGEQLKQLRLQAGVLKRTAAIHAGVTLSLFYDWEEGFELPTPEQIAKLCDFYTVVYEKVRATGGVRA